MSAVVSLLAVGSQSSPTTVDSATTLPLTPEPSKLVEYDVYVREYFDIHPYGNKTITTIAFGLSPDGPFSVPGPELRIREGDTLRVRLHDTGGFSGHTLHWHGIKLPWAMDGMPWMTQEISPPESYAVYTYEWTATQSGTYWYHCHVDAPAHVDIGMFGPLVIEPKDPAQDRPFDREYTLMLHEMDSMVFVPIDAAGGATGGLESPPKNPFDLAGAVPGMVRATADFGGWYAGPVGTALGSQGPRDYYPEYSARYRPQYDTFMINGKSFPDTEPLLIKTGETIRARIVNAGQLVHTMHLHGHVFTVTHKDGHLLPAPWKADTVLLGPGERYDVYIEGDNPGHWDFHDHGGAWGVGGFTSNDYAFPGGMSVMLTYEDFSYTELPKPAPVSNDPGPDGGNAVARVRHHAGHHR